MLQPNKCGPTAGPWCLRPQHQGPADAQCCGLRPRRIRLAAGFGVQPKRHFPCSSTRQARGRQTTMLLASGMSLLNNGLRQWRSCGETLTSNLNPIACTISYCTATPSATIQQHNCLCVDIHLDIHLDNVHHTLNPRSAASQATPQE